MDLGIARLDHTPCPSLTKVDGNLRGQSGAKSGTAIRLTAAIDSKNRNRIGAPGSVIEGIEITIARRHTNIGRGDEGGE